MNEFGVQGDSRQSLAAQGRSLAVTASPVTETDQKSGGYSKELFDSKSLRLQRWFCIHVESSLRERSPAASF